MKEKKSPVEKIHIRKIEFTLNDENANYWLCNSLTISSTINAISTLVIAGEQFFIDSAAHFRKDIHDPCLREQVKGFIAQETLHTKAHRKVNEAIRKTNKNEQQTESLGFFVLNPLRKLLPARTQLAVSSALEHFTALGADALLKNKDIVDEADPQFSAVFVWHFVEEVEHKSVCFDLHRSVTGKISGYLERSIVMAFTTLILCAVWALSTWLLIKGDQSPKRNTLPTHSFISFMFGKKPGFFRRQIGHYFSYYHPKFHPWNYDNSQFIDSWGYGIK